MVLLIVVIAAALSVIAGGIWVAVALVKAISKDRTVSSGKS